MDIKKLKELLNEYEETIDMYLLGEDGSEYEIFHIEKDRYTGELVLAIRKPMSKEE